MPPSTEKLSTRDAQHCRRLTWPIAPPERSHGRLASDRRSWRVRLLTRPLWRRRCLKPQPGLRRLAIRTVITLGDRNGGIGDEDQFPPPTLSARSVMRMQTVAAIRRNEREAPITDDQAATRARSDRLEHRGELVSCTRHTRCPGLFGRRLHGIWGYARSRNRRT
jgi:hypothetical protein